ncbi:competence protein ComK [Alkalibacterium pelagium]|uniref:ComK protein n=1 Tax=Alkalibacterium pelagium TaxID=426702 RepID=A0A1H7HR11_9LACT|nr:competence protein ComK [Alkalibacterium pelagium]GEN50369.1 hypothetical protein APE02nite_10340 [Alkalibacterium pelagium]SEK52786.1 ComK protein [Alkalibacterium pelagium]
MDKLYNKYVRQLEDYVLKEQASRYLTPIIKEDRGRSFFDHLKIDVSQILNHLDVSIEQKYITIDRTCFYVCDLSKEVRTTYNTIVFNLYGSPLKSTETTTQIMNRSFNAMNIKYDMIRQLGKALGISQKCPYVLGPMCFAPDKGTKHNHASWIGIHNVRDIYSHEKQTLLSIKNEHELLIDLDVKKTDKLVTNGHIIYQAQESMVKGWNALYQEESDDYQNWNILKKRSLQQTFSQKIPTLFSCLMFFSYFQALEMLRTVLKEGDPLLEDVMKEYPKFML